MVDLKNIDFSAKLTELEKLQLENGMLHSIINDLFISMDKIADCRGTGSARAEALRALKQYRRT